MIARIKNTEIAIMGGVLSSGIAYRLGLPVWTLRFVFIISLFFTLSLSLILYLFLWVIMPSKYISKQDFDLEINQKNKPVDIDKKH